jgi:hypothetical protein
MPYKSFLCVVYSVSSPPMWCFTGIQPPWMIWFTICHYVALLVHWLHFTLALHRWFSPSMSSHPIFPSHLQPIHHSQAITLDLHIALWHLFMYRMQWDPFLIVSWASSTCLSEGKSSDQVAECTCPDPKMRRGLKDLSDWLDDVTPKILNLGLIEEIWAKYHW